MITVADELLSSTGVYYSSFTVKSVGQNVWTGDMVLANELNVQVAAGSSLEVDGNITGYYLVQLRVQAS